MIQASLNHPESFLLICPQCFDCWAKLVGRDISHWWHRYVPCEQHTYQGSAYGAKLGGSILAVEDIPIDALPTFLLGQELLLYLKEVS